MQKILTVIGTRPQYVKAAVLSRAFLELAPDEIHETVVDTGQHFDDNMSRLFLEKLGGLSPRLNLGISGGGHSSLTGRMLVALEPVLERERPDAVLVYGDTDSTLAGALSAAQAGLPLIHVESGLRSGDRTMPEEINRIVTDSLASINLCPTKNALANLVKAGLGDSATFVGDLMLDSFVRARGTAPASLPKNGFERSQILITLHRPSNVDSDPQFLNILSGIQQLARHYNIVWPVHPRTRKKLEELKINPVDFGVDFREPMNHDALLSSLADSQLVITDSGGLQKEAYFSGVGCLVLRKTSEWPELIASGAGRLVDIEVENLFEATQSHLSKTFTPDYEMFGGGGVAEKAVSVIVNSLRNRLLIG